mgnify:CR=1 FL=1
MHPIPKIQICTMLTGMYRLIVGMKCIRTILLCTQPANFADITAVGILLERGVDTNARNDDGDIPLCVMAKRNSCPNDTLYADISGLLLYEGAKVTRSGKNTTALIEAVRNRQFFDGRCPSDVGKPY